MLLVFFSRGGWEIIRVSGIFYRVWDLVELLDLDKVQYERLWVGNELGGLGQRGLI